MRTSLSLALGLALVGLVACGDDGGGNNNPGIDAAVFEDARVDAPPAPLMITISGTATERGLGGSTPVADALIGAYASSDENTPLTTTMTDVDGNFTMTVETTGEAITGYLKATKADYTDTYLYPPGPLAADLMGAPINMVTTGTFELLSTVAQGDQVPGNGLIAVVVASGTVPDLMPVAGATITTEPTVERYRYNGMNGLPDANATSTQADGVAYAFNVPPGGATVTAAMAGATFGTTSVKSFADSLITTTVVQQ